MRVLWLLSISTFLVGLFLTSLSPVASATTGAMFSVNDQTDAVDINIGDGTCQAANGKCTLRAAIQETNRLYELNPTTHYTISVSGGPPNNPRIYPLTIAGSHEDNAATGDLDIKCDLALQSTTFGGVIVDASALGDRIFHIIQPTNVPMNVSIINIGMINGSVAGEDGGGLLNDRSASLTLTFVKVLSNTVSGQFVAGGGIGIHSFGTTVLNNVLLRANRVQVSNNGSGSGGGLSSYGNLVVNNSFVYSNSISYGTPSDTDSAFGGGIGVICCGDPVSMTGSQVFGNSIVAANNFGSTHGFAKGGGIFVGVPMTITDSSINDNSITTTAGGFLEVEGGGISTFSTLSLFNSAVTGNHMSTSAMSLHVYGGGLGLNASTQIIKSTLTNNHVGLMGGLSGFGGALSTDADADGAQIQVIRSILSNNSASWGGGAYVNVSNTLSIRDSTLSANQADGGGGIANTGGVLTVTNSTLALNTANVNGGGLYVGYFGHAIVSSVTLSGNAADQDSDNSGDGGGIYVSLTGDVRLQNTILAHNVDWSPSGSADHDCAGSITSNGYNLILQPMGCFMPPNHDIFSLDPGLGPLQDNGGPTPTMALAPTSIAVNGGDPAGCKDATVHPLAIDQRGFPRLGACDIGAFEFMLRRFLPLVAR